MEKIIALYGKSKMGKTTTLNILIDMLRIVSSSYKIEKEYDSRATFEFAGKTISVCTPGDDVGVIEKNCDYFSEHKCDIAVTATRTKGKGKDEIEKFAAKENAKYFKIQKVNGRKKNKLFAAKLFQMIISDLKEINNIKEESNDIGE